MMKYKRQFTTDAGVSCSVMIGELPGEMYWYYK